MELWQFEGDLGGFKDALGNWVCEFGDSTCYYPTEGTPPSDANARLIAAAPDLLEALTRMVSTGLSEREHHEFLSDPQHYARAAIRKATEETP